MSIGLAPRPGFVARVAARAIAPRKSLSVSQWADAERVLSSKGSAEAGRWRTARNPVLREPMDALSARSHVRDVVCMFPIQLGKALALDTPIPTPSGWTTMGTLQPGDEVFGADGLPVKVLLTSEVFLDHPCYRITFSDGESVVADAGHRWAVVDTLARSDAHTVVLTTKALHATHRHRQQSRYAIPVAAPLQLPEASLPIDPYVLGVWLGDGGTHNAQLTLNADDAGHIVSRIEAAGHRCDVRPAKGHAVNVLIDGRGGEVPTFHRRLAELGVLHNKHIPAQYLRSSFAQRMALLRGLLDTDGHAQNGGLVEICSSYPALSAGIVELLRSVGMKPVVKTRKTRARDSDRITFSVFPMRDVFSLPRKQLALGAGGPRSADLVPFRFIVSVEPVPSVPTRCIAVDNADHLFLCGRGFIPTHNTEIALNFLGYIMDQNPGPTMVCLPGEVSMNKWIAQKLTPMIDETPAVRRALTTTATRDGANRREFKDFAGGQLYLEHAGSPSRLKSTTVRNLIVDELDEFAGQLTGGDDPVAMLEGRTSAFPANYRRLYISTPQVRGLSRIEQLYAKSDQRRYHVPCPHCGHMQPLEWGGLHWTPDARQCWYACRECGAVIEEHHKPDMLAAGQWVPANPESPIRGYHVNGLYYPIGLGPRWLDLVRMWLDAQGDPARLKTFINDRLAEPWEDPAMRAVKHNIIADRAEPYPLRTAPAGVLAITAGVDTQDNRLAVQIVGWGRGMAAWTLDYIELPGDPAEDEVWARLTDLLNRPIESAMGAPMVVEAVAIDAGGHRTEAVKHFVRQRLVRRPLCIFGAVPNNHPILGKPKLQDVNWRGRLDKRGIHIHHVGTVAAKHLLYSRLSTDADKPTEARLVRFSADLPREYFTGLVSETYNPAKNRFEKRGGARNEPLDTWVYAFAAAHHPELRFYRFTRTDWDAREAALRQRSAAPAGEDQQAAAAAAPRLPTTPPAAPIAPSGRPARAPISRPGRPW